jgi:hypothetical protein
MTQRRKYHMWNFIVCLYTNNKNSEKEITKRTPFIIASEIMKSLGVKWTKGVKNLYDENYETLLKILKKTNISHVHGLEYSILWRCQYYPKWSTSLVQSLSKFQWHFLQK